MPLDTREIYLPSFIQHYHRGNSFVYYTNCHGYRMILFTDAGERRSQKGKTVVQKKNYMYKTLFNTWNYQFSAQD